MPPPTRVAHSEVMAVVLPEASVVPTMEESKGNTTSAQPQKVFVVEMAPSRMARTVGPVVVASAVLAPLLLLPYFITRSQLRRTASQLDKLQSLPHQLERFESELVHRLKSLKNSGTEEQNVWARRVDTAEMETKVLKEGMEELRRRLDRLSMRVEAESEIAKSRAAQPPQREVKLVTVQEDPRIPSQVLNEIGSALSNVAAFMEEIETKDGLTRKGIDPRGISRMRDLALRLEKITKT